MASKKAYIKMINLAKSLEELNDLIDKIDGEEFDEEVITELNNLVNEKVSLLQPVPKEEDTIAERWLFPEGYDTNDNIGKPDYKSLIPSDMSYVEWLQDVLFKDFIYIPDAALQVPILTAACFINSKVVGDNTALPMLYHLSNKPDSGKTTTANFIGKHYNPKFFLYVGEDSSGAGFRNDVNTIAQHKQPCCILIDNYDPKLSKERFGVFYARFLKNVRSECLVKVADQEGGNIVFNTHAFKIFTSVYSLGNSAPTGSEMKTRCIQLLFENAENKLKDSIISYDWSNLPDEYYNIWKDPALVNREFKPLTIELDRIPLQDLNIHTRQWQISKHLIAVGTFIGVWKTLDDGINHLERYWKWIARQERGSKMPLNIIIETYVNVEHIKKLKAKRKYYGEAVEDLDMHEDRISLSMIYEFLKASNMTLTRSDSNNNKITDIMLGLGWFQTIERNKSNIVIDLMYVRDVK